MQFKSVKQLLLPLIKGGQKWQSIDINGKYIKPKYYFNNTQWGIIIICVIVQFKFTKGLSKEVIGYIISIFSISVSLFLSLLVSIFDKFENTNFSLQNITEKDAIRLIQKKNYFKRFISIISYLIVLSIFLIILCCPTYFINMNYDILYNNFTLDIKEIHIWITIKSIIIIIYRIVLYYFILMYLLLTLFITGSAYEYYISEIDSKKLR
jgi:hypothetical protein